MENFIFLCSANCAIAKGSIAEVIGISKIKLDNDIYYS